MTPSQDLLASLDPEQRQVATAPAGPLCVLAGAGTGKTRAITARIAHAVLTDQVAPTSVLAVTFTARAAGEMRGRLRAMDVGGVQARTFHAAALRQLQFFWPRAVGSPPPRLVDSKLPVLAEACSRAALRSDRTVLRDLAAEVEWRKSALVPVEGYAEAAAAARRTAPPGWELPRVQTVLEGYEEVKRDRGLMDFEDVLLLTIGLLADYPDVRREVTAQYTTFVVDEYQDVSALQQQLLEQWLAGRHDLTVVGDPGQTIYSFAGADPRYLLGFQERHPGAQVVRLVRSYRCTPQIVAAANAVLPSRQHGGVALRSVVADGPEPRVLSFADEVAEARGVAADIARRVAEGVPASQVAVLFRTNAQSQSLEEALTDVNVPFVLRGTERFWERPEVRQALVLLRGAARGATAPEGPSLVAAVRDVLSSSGWSADEPPAAGPARERWESLSALVRLAEELQAAAPAATFADYVAELAERAASAHAPAVEGVTLASLHAAKGLEWDEVYLVGVGEGLLPISHAQTAAAIEEERRLLYVGVTRARRRLQLSWTTARTPGGPANRRPSRFLAPLLPESESESESRPRPGATGAARGRRSRSTVERRPATCRSCGALLPDGVSRKLGRCPQCPGDVDLALLERLREWRTATAKAASVPAFVVFTDATLLAIAERRPADRCALSAVSGVGAAKLEKFGEDVLALVAGTTAS
ncbi:MAG: ATP-dependent DNA helicase UvrD2 [Actinomycetales bacterium]